MRYAQLENSFISIMSHEEDECTESVCAVHKRTDHHMRNLKQLFSKIDGIMCRVCMHGHRHPDPDDQKVISGEHNGKHDCDACCIRFATEEECNGGNNN